MICEVKVMRFSTCKHHVTFSYVIKESLNTVYSILASVEIRSLELIHSAYGHGSPSLYLSAAEQGEMVDVERLVVSLQLVTLSERQLSQLGVHASTCAIVLSHVYVVRATCTLQLSLPDVRIVQYNAHVCFCDFIVCDFNKIRIIAELPILQ